MSSCACWTPTPKGSAATVSASSARTRGELIRLVEETARTTDVRPASVERTLDSRLEAIQQDANARLAETAGPAGELLRAWAAVPARVETSLKPFTDCEANGLCWQGQVSDSLFAFRHIARTVALQSRPRALWRRRRATSASGSGPLAGTGRFPKPSARSCSDRPSPQGGKRTCSIGSKPSP